MRSPEFQKFKLDGIILDLPPEQLPLDKWSYGYNVHFKNLATERSAGYATFGDPLSGAPVFAMSVDTPDRDYWLYCTDTAIFVTDGLTHNDITPVGGITTTPKGAWTGDILNGIPVLNNGADVPIFWDTSVSSPCEPLPGWDAGWRCKAIRANKYHLVALNMTVAGVDYPDLYYWSEGADPGAIPQAWVPAPDNDAGSNTVSDTQGWIVDGLRLRDQFIIYKTKSCYALEYVGGEFVFNQRLLFNSSGVQGTNCVAEMEGVHYVLTNDDVIRHDGNTMDSVVTWKMKENILGSINPEVNNMCCVTAKHLTNEVWISIPAGGNTALDVAYVVNTVTQDVGVRTLPDVAHVAAGVVARYDEAADWDSDSESWDLDLTQWNAGTYNPTSDVLMLSDMMQSRLLEVDGARDNAGVPVDALIERTGMQAQQGPENLFVSEIWPRITGTDGDVIKVTVGGQMRFDDPVEWGMTHDYIIGDKATQMVPVRQHKRFFAIRFQSTGGDVWRLHGFTAAAVQMGRW